MRRKMLIAGTVLLLALAVLVLLFGKEPQTAGPLEPLPGGTLPSLPPPESVPLPQGSTLTVAGVGGSVVVRNFYQDAAIVSPTAVEVAAVPGEYSITYARPNSQFYVAILGYGRAGARATRAKAEAQLLTALAIPEAEACRLSLSVTVSAASYEAEPLARVPNYGLSFCPDAVPL